MAIIRCALAIIQKRGSEVTPPSQIADLTVEETSFLERHVTELRTSIGKDGAVRARFRDNSELETQFESLRNSDTDETTYLETCAKLVDSLADAMRGAPRAEDCVVAVVSARQDSEPSVNATILKLDAEIEGANLTPQADGSIRLEVFTHLLPAPGKLQKGLSWPDPRTESELILLDTNRSAAAQYFQNAFSVEASPRPVDSEKALTDAIQRLEPERAIEAAQKATEKEGPADQVAAELKEEYPDLDTTASELGGSGGYAGSIRHGRIGRTPHIYRSDGIELKVPTSELNRITVATDGAGFVTTIRTSQPLGPYQN